MFQALWSVVRNKKRCGVCLFLLTNDARRLSLDISENFWDTFSSKDHLEFGLGDLEESARRGCVYCAVILKHLNTRQVNFTTAQWFLAEYQPGPDRPFLQLQGSEMKLELCVSTSQFDSEIRPRYPMLSRGDRLEGHTGDAKALARAAGWLAECRDKHQGCEPQDTSFVPTRLLYLGETGSSATVSLREDAPQGTRYAALSHRWSNETLASRTETRNLQDRKNNIPMDEFPKMMQDVINVLRHLQINYVWIDCMCIIQDDLEDWQHEAPRMADIYSNAELTISVTWLESSAQSLYSDRGGVEFASTDITELSDAKGIVHVRESPSHFATFGDVHGLNTGSDPNREWPLLYRGWVYQEQVLSRRVLHFTRSELRWDCNETAACECGRFLFGSQKDGFPSERAKKVTVTSREWIELVEEYTKGQLTKDGDKLPALAGICSVYGLDMQNDYLCGLWRSELSSTLLWRLNSSVGPRPPIRMPTWTWASVSGAVSFRSDTLYNIEFTGSHVTYRGKPSMGESLDARITLKGNVVHGILQYGSAWKETVEKSKLKSSAKKVLLNPGLPIETMETVFGVTVSGGNYFNILPDYAMELEDCPQEPSSIEVHCLIMAQDSHTIVETGGKVSKEQILACGLVLRCVDSELGYYERIGYFEGWDWENSLELETAVELAEMMTLTLV